MFSRVRQTDRDRNHLIQAASMTVQLILTLIKLRSLFLFSIFETVGLEKLALLIFLIDDERNRGPSAALFCRIQIDWQWGEEESERFSIIALSLDSLRPIEHAHASLIHAFVLLISRTAHATWNFFLYVGTILNLGLREKIYFLNKKTRIKKDTSSSSRFEFLDLFEIDERAHVSNRHCE